MIFSRIKKALSNLLQDARRLFTPSMIVDILLGTAITSFGIYNIHQQANITEGGVFGMILLLNHWVGLSASIASPLLDIVSYAVAFRYLGKDFLMVSIACTLSLAGFFRLWEQFPPMLPNLSPHPLIAAILGGVLIGVGAGLVVRRGGAGSGDDALALAISKTTRWPIARAYLVTDLTVLLLSLTYIPLGRIAYSLITVCISSPLIGLIQKTGHKGKKDQIEAPAEAPADVMAESDHENVCLVDQSGHPANTDYVDAEKQMAAFEGDE